MQQSDHIEGLQNELSQKDHQIYQLRCLVDEIKRERAEQDEHIQVEAQ